VFVAAADENNVSFLGTQVADIGVRWQVRASQVANMFQSIGVRQGGSDQVSFWSHYHFLKDANLP
jgi:hypothetical protein